MLNLKTYAARLVAIYGGDPQFAMKIVSNRAILADDNEEFQNHVELFQEIEVIQACADDRLLKKFGKAS